LRWISYSRLCAFLMEMMRLALPSGAWAMMTAAVPEIGNAAYT